jgi:hypothetical protein
MSVYLGTNKVKVILNGVLYNIISPFSSSNTIDGNYLKSSDNYILTDSNGVYLVPKQEITVLSSKDNYILTDSNEIYLTPKEAE